MTKLIFSFDTEDFTSSKNADAIITEAEILRGEGVRGCFCLVGLLAKQLQAWGRDDVLCALSHHEIDLHTYGHTLHPMLNEYTDIEDAHAAIAEVVRRESEAVELIRGATGCDKIYTAVPPGNQKSYAAMYAYADMGIPIYADTFCDTDDGRGVYYCGIYHMNYTYSMENDFFSEKVDFDKLLDRFAKKDHVVVYTHPHASLVSECWDVLNYDKENLREFGDFIEAEARPASEIANFYANMREFVRRIKADPRFCITTYADIARELNAQNEIERVITREDVPTLRQQIKEALYPVTLPNSFSLADMFCACRALLCGEERYVAGKTYGFLSAPYAVSEELLLSVEDMIASAHTISSDGFLPERISVGGVDIGPADWLRAALAVLDGETEVRITPDVALPSLDALSRLKGLSFKGTWRHSDSFEDRYLSDRLRLQIWTMRFRKGYSRFV